MKGTLANAAAIAAGGGLGLALRRGFSERHREVAMQAMGLCVALVGLQMALKADRLLVLVGSMALGGLLGETLAIERRLEALGERLRRLARSDESGFAQAFTATSLMFCVGSMAVVGSIEDGARGDPQILYTKAALDGVISLASAASMGPGVLFSALPVLAYQGALTVGAAAAARHLPGAAIDAMSATGGLLIFAIGINLLGLAKIRVGNLLPAIFLAGLPAIIWP